MPLEWIALAAWLSSIAAAVALPAESWLAMRSTSLTAAPRSPNPRNRRTPLVESETSKMVRFPFAVRRWRL
jgi:hypothetical protein